MKLIAHRGASDSAPENTMKAFQLAWSLGVDGVELDVRRTADGKLVVFHDDDGRRLARDPRQLSECTYHDLQSWSLGGETIPLLEDVLALAPSGSITLVELKDPPEVLPDVQLVLSRFADKSTALLSFDQQTAGLAAAGPVPVWLNVGAAMTPRLQLIIRDTKRSQLSGISLGWSNHMNQEVVNMVHAAGLQLAVWTVNNRDDGQRALEWGVDILMTDRPSTMLPLVNHGR